PAAAVVVAVGLWGALTALAAALIVAPEALAAQAGDAGALPVGAISVGAALVTLGAFALGLLVRPPSGSTAAEAADETPRPMAGTSETHRRFAAALDNMSQGLCMYDRHNMLQLVNRRFCEIYRIDPARIRPGISFRDVIAASIASGNHTATDVDGLVGRRLAFVSRRVRATSFQELADGRVIAISHEPLGDGGWVVTYEDITERRRAEAQITHMARHDGLTGLPNRTHFRERIEAAADAGVPFAVLTVDLDDFRAINEAHGSQAGDAVLRETAARLIATAPEGSIVGRLGGDEFAVIQWPVAGPDAASCLAEQLIGALSAPIDAGGVTLAVGASIGIAVAPGDGDCADSLLAHADLARDLARRDARGSFRFFEPGMDARQQKRRLLEADLRHALGRGEFALHYQPLVAVPDGTVTGLEALLRWRHPRRGLVSPAEFIPLAEQLDLIGPIGAWVLGEACREAMRFPPTIRVAVNVSPVQFRRPGLVESVADALERSGLAPQRLELEITESVVLDDSDLTRETLHRLKALGVRIALDDFGTGYSSLTTLRSFPIDKIKIDQSFTRDLGISPDARSIVNAIASLGRALEMSTTAEGVETEEQLACLAAEGCAEAQGYLFSRPRPAEEIPALLRTLEAKNAARAQRLAGSACDILIPVGATAA
ncbi:putative bifunctional diguanylate cyclase/phosphodiesterase, partial [Elioraea rosea]|uniref:putative bifunctional diguanylate cyclase/phosphodiesterase n=1 Tax=Elioraea rosea TaxID=2492390 RepID=UPI0019503624